MAVKLISPLFGTSVSGTVSRVGTFRMINGQSFISHRQFGLLGNDNGSQAMRDCFATAKAGHAAIEPTWAWIGGVWGLRRDPFWPEYWAQYLQDNPACFL